MSASNSAFAYSIAVVKDSVWPRASRLAGDHSEVEIPVPIPNTVVKHLSADGTAEETSWESRSLPAYSGKPPPRMRWGLLSCPILTGAS